MRAPTLQEEVDALRDRWNGVMLEFMRVGREHRIQREEYLRTVKGMRSIAGSLRRALFDTMIQEQSGLCGYCVAPLSGEVHLEHRVPLSRGGTNDRENLCLSCQRCNMAKHTDTAEEFLAREA